MPKPSSILPLLALVAALFATGCGGGSNAPLSKADFIKQGDAICKEKFDERSANYLEYGKAHPSARLSTEEIVTMFTLPSIQETAEELDALGAPKSDEKKINAIVVGVEEGVEKAEKQIEKDPEGFEALLAPAAKMAGEYGLNCGETF
jgi:hypothetical protein